MRRNHVLSWTALPDRRVRRVTAPMVPTVPRCKSAASAVRRIARHGTPCRSRERTGAYPLTAMGLRRGTTRLPGREPGVGGDQVVARRIVRDGERSPSWPKTRRRTTTLAPNGWRDRCRKTRRGRRMRRRRNTRQGLYRTSCGIWMSWSQGNGWPITTEHVSGSVPGRPARPRDAGHPATRADFPLCLNFGQAARWSLRRDWLAFC